VLKKNNDRLPAPGAAGDLIKLQCMTPSAVLGSKGGSAAVATLGPDYFSARSAKFLRRIGSGRGR
jgi:hypothetical protein